MKKIKLYNLIFPTFMLFAFHPLFWVLSLIGNFIIDTFVIFVISIIVFRKIDFKFYRITILKVWLLGFLSDLIGAIYLCIVSIKVKAVYYEGANLFKNFLSGVYVATNHSHFDSIWGVLFVLSGIIISALFIYFFNYALTFNSYKFDVISKRNRVIASLILAICTAPYTFLFPSEFFY